MPTLSREKGEAKTRVCARFGGLPSSLAPTFLLFSGPRFCFSPRFFSPKVGVLNFKNMKTLLLSTLILATPLLAQEATPTATPESPTTDSQNNDALPNDEKVIVVTAERNSQPLAESPSAVAVVTREQIEAKKPFDLLGVLRLLPGISVAQSGTRGKTTSIFTRGTNSNQTLVLVDGVRANSPQDGRFDFGQIPVENVERVELVRGPGSALYGSDALGGVINIITKRGNGPLKPGGLLEFGNQGINRQEVSANGAFGKNNENRLSFSGFRLDTNGQFQNDDYRNTGASLRFDRELAANKTLSFIGRSSQAKFGVPGQRNLNFDPFQRDDTRDTQLSLQFENRDRKRRDKIVLGQYDRRLSDDDTRDKTAPTAAPSRFANKVQSLDAQTSYDFGQNTLTAGLESRRETADIISNFAFVDFTSGAVQTGGSKYDKGTRTNALFAQNEYKSGKFTLVPGVRYEDNSQFGDFTSYRVAGAYDVTPMTRFKASYGTAFKAPSFDSLYFPNFGNPNLQPETSRGYDAGILQKFGDGTVELTYYNNKIKNLIGSDPKTFLPANINRAKTHGFELSLDKPINRDFRLLLSGNTTATSSSSSKLLRRPEFNASADLIANRGKFQADLGVVAQGKRFDSNFVNEFVAREYGGYVRTDFTLSYRVRPQLDVYARFGNLLDRKYEEVAGYQAPRFNVSIGIKALTF